MRKIRYRHYKRKLFQKVLQKDARYLVVAPHPDDEVLGCGGLLLQHASQCDVVVFSSSGLQWKDITAKERSVIRMKEFHIVMDYIGVAKRYIYETYGIPFFIETISNRYEQYIQDISFGEYDYICMPHPLDNHPEHVYITNVLMKKILRSLPLKKTCTILFYEVWTPMQNPNFLLDISNIVEEKKNIIRMYPSQLVAINYVKHCLGLNCYRAITLKNASYAEAYTMIPVYRYLI